MATTRRTTKKAAAAPKKDAAKAAEPMDPSIVEQPTPEPIKRRQRECYAMQTLVAEVTALFPETDYEATGINAFSVALDVSFADHESPDLYPLLSLIEGDERVALVDRDSAEHRTFVSFRDSMRTYDLRTAFGLAEAHAILTAENDAAAVDAMHVDEDEEADQ